MNKSTGSAACVPTRFDEAVDRLDGDVSLLREMAMMTAPEFDKLIRQVDEAIASKEPDETARLLHKLKGMLSTFESDGVVLEIQEMIHTARGKRLDTTAALMTQNRDAIDDLVSEIHLLAKG